MTKREKTYHRYKGWIKEYFRVIDPATGKRYFLKHFVNYSQHGGLNEFVLDSDPPTIVGVTGKQPTITSDMNTDIAKQDEMLPGGLGSMTVNGLTRPITGFRKHNDGSVTLVFNAVVKTETTEDADCEIVQQKQLDKPVL